MTKITLTNGCFIFLLTLAASAPALSSAENMRPECAEWKKQVEATIKPVNDTEFTFRENKKFADVLALFKSYPDVEAYVIRAHDQKLTKSTVDAITSRPGCAQITYYDVAKRFFSAKEINQKESKQVLQAVLNRIMKDDDQSPSLVQLLLDVSLMDMAIKANTLKPSDAAYFSYLEIRKEVDQFKNSVRNENERSSSFDCLTKKSCSDADYDVMLHSLHKEYQGTKSLQHWLSGWARRAQA